MSIKNKEEFFKQLEGAPTGYKGDFFLVHDLIDNSEELKKLKLNSIEDTVSILKLIDSYDRKNYSEEFDKFYNLILNNASKSNISKFNFDIKKLAEQNSKYIWNKHIHLLLPYLYINDQDYVNERLTFQNFEFIQDNLNNKKGAILSLFHWGMFQNFIPVFLTKKIKVNFIANFYACMYLKGLIESYIPNYLEYVDFIVVGDPAILKKSVSKINKGEFICILPELSLGLKKPTIKHEFLGNSVYVPEGVAAISVLSGCEIIPCYIEENNLLGYDIKFLNPIKNSSNNLKDLSTLSKKLFEILEHEILNQPSKWCGWEIYHRMIINS